MKHQRNYLLLKGLEDDQEHNKPSSEPNELKEPKQRGRPSVEKPPKVNQPRGRPIIQCNKNYTSTNQS